LFQETALQRHAHYTLAFVPRFFCFLEKIADGRIAIAHRGTQRQLAVFDGMRPHERVAVLLQFLGRVEFAKADIAPAV
jgi:hypothetical protein